MRLSIIIPTLNEEDQLPRLLHQLRAQCHADDEILVVDGGSTDQTAQIAQQNKVRLLVGPRGRGSQLSLGGAHALGSRLWFLHADTHIPPGCLHALRRAPGRWGCFHVRVDAPQLRLRWAGAFMGARARWGGSCTGDMGIWADHDFFEELGGFAPWPAFEDMDFSDRARARLSAQVLPISLQTSARRWERDGINSTILRMWVLRSGYRLGAPPDQLCRWYLAFRS